MCSPHGLAPHPLPRPPCVPPASPCPAHRIAFISVPVVWAPAALAVSSPALITPPTRREKGIELLPVSGPSEEGPCMRMARRMRV